MSPPLALSVLCLSAEEFESFFFRFLVLLFTSVYLNTTCHQFYQSLVVGSKKMRQYYNDFTVTVGLKSTENNWHHLSGKQTVNLYTISFLL